MTVAAGNDKNNRISTVEDLTSNPVCLWRFKPPDLELFAIPLKNRRAQLGLRAFGAWIGAVFVAPPTGFFRVSASEDHVDVSRRCPTPGFFHLWDGDQ